MEHSEPFIQSSSEDLLGPMNAVEKKHAPELLFAAGEREILRRGPRVSVVGSRKASPEGIRQAASLCRLLVEKAVVVVSGLAAGIDKAAHETAFRSGGRTIAVLGTPLDQVYPPEHADLQRLIMKEHLVLSQFPAGTPSRRSNFPQRNRTMALISDATVIVEAGDGSGTLHQGWEALRLGRPLFLMRSVAEDVRLRWPKEMIGYGARVILDEDAGELIERLPSRACAPDVLLAF